MTKTNPPPAYKLEDILDRPVGPQEAWDVADFLLACLTHVTNARPLFGVVDIHYGLLEWTAGGAEFHDVLEPYQGDSRTGASGKLTTFMQLFSCFGIAGEDFAQVAEDADALNPGTAMTILKPLKGAGDRFFRLVLRKRQKPNDHQVQFTLMDITAFQETSDRTRAMAKTLLSDLDARLESGAGTRQQLQDVLSGLDTLFGLQDDGEIAALAQDLSARVTAVTERMVKMLLEFESRHDIAHWQPRVLDPALRPVIGVHSAPVNDWHELHSEVLCTVDGKPAIVAELAEQLHHALTFVRNAASIMIVSPAEGRIFALNGPAAETQFTNVEDFVRAIGVEGNSMRTATEFFSNLSTEPALGLFAVNGQNVEAWGRPGLYGGWQAMLLPGTNQGVDVRGMFHGIKNLLLHLQVLYVVKTRADVDQVQAALFETRSKIETRFKDLEIVAQTGRRGYKQVQESVAQWVAGAKLIGQEAGGEVEVSCDGVEGTVFSAQPGEMEDAFEELVRNAFLQGAKKVFLGAMRRGDHLCMHVTDDGPGMSEEKLSQVRKVLQSRKYDPALTTRENGTGNGLLAAANAVARFVDGQMMVDPGPGGRGVKFTLSMKMPA